MTTNKYDRNTAFKATESKNICVFGAGNFGTALASLAAKKGHK
eukprot:gene12677-20693_t